MEEQIDIAKRIEDMAIELYQVADEGGDFIGKLAEIQDYIETVGHQMTFGE